MRPARSGHPKKTSSSPLIRTLASPRRHSSPEFLPRSWPARCRPPESRKRAAHRAPPRAFHATLRAIVRPQPAGGEYGDYVAGKGRDRNRGGPRHRQRHRSGVREGRRAGSCGESKRRRGPDHDEGDRRGRRRSVVSPGQRQESRRHGANGGNLHRALRRYRHPLRQRRRLPYVPYRRHDRRGLGRRARHQPEGRFLRRPGLHPGR